MQVFFSSLICRNVSQRLLSFMDKSDRQVIDIADEIIYVFALFSGKSHKGLIGFMSGEHAGHGKTLASCLVRKYCVSLAMCCHALSCIEHVGCCSSIGTATGRNTLST